MTWVKALNVRWLDLGSVLTATGASLASAAAGVCCIGPLALTLLGVQGAILAAGVKPYRFYLLAASLLLLVLAHWSVRRRARAAAGAACSVSAGRWTKRILWAATILWFGALVIQIAADRYWL